MTDFRISPQISLLIVCLLVPGLQTAAGQSLLETSMEARYQLDLKVPEAALSRHIPRGWTMDIRTEGAAKDANLRLIFIERISVNGPDGKPVGDGSNMLVYLAAPVKNPAGESVQLIIGGITEDPADAPGPFAVYLPASRYSLDRVITNYSGPVIETQNWTFEAASGEYIRMNINFERGAVDRREARDRLYCSAKSPDVCQLTKQEQMLDIMRNVTTNPPDRVSTFSLEAGGGSYADLFNGTEKVLSWDNILWLDQEIYQP